MSFSIGTDDGAVSTALLHSRRNKHRSLPHCLVLFPSQAALISQLSTVDLEAAAN
jgi:hypothetical protein